MLRSTLSAAAVVLFTLAPGVHAGDRYTLDPTHTYPSFEISHLGFSTQRGRFNETSGNIVLDRAGKALSADIRIRAASVDTGLAKLEDHLRNADFFDADKHPEIRFIGSRARFDGDRPVELSGEFTLLGVTRPLTLTISHFQCGVHPKTKKDVCGADASATIKRSDYGMTYGVPAIGDEVRLLIQVEAVKD